MRGNGRDGQYIYEPFEEDFCNIFPDSTAVSSVRLESPYDFGILCTGMICIVHKLVCSIFLLWNNPSSIRVYDASKPQDL